MAPLENKRHQGESTLKMARFQPVQSGNPGGRPKEVGHVKELARQQTLEAVRVLAAIMADEKEPAAARVRAAEALFDRGWGRPAQQIGGELNSNRDVRDMSTAELLAFLASHPGPGRDEPPEIRTTALDRRPQPTIHPPTVNFEH